MLALLASLCCPILIHLAKGLDESSDRTKVAKALAVVVTVLNLLLVPLQFKSDAHVQNVVLFFLIGWLATFKAIGYAFGRGPLCSDDLTLVGTFVAYALPINPVEARGQRMHSSKRTKKTTAMYALEVVRHLLLLIFSTAVSHRLQRVPYGPSGVAHMLTSDLVDALNLYAFIAVIMNGASIGMNQGQKLLGFSEIMPHCDRPWLATHFGEFWSRRWNINTGYTLRYLIYDPVCEGSLKRKDGRRERCSNARRVVALASTFAVSGLAHECFIFWLRGVHSGQGRWFLFFFLQALLIVLVDPLLKRLSIKSPNCRWLARSVTIGAELLLAHQLFFLPVIELGITNDIHEGVNHGIRILLSNDLFVLLYPES